MVATTLMWIVESGRLTIGEGEQKVAENGAALLRRLSPELDCTVAAIPHPKLRVCELHTKPLQKKKYKGTLLLPCSSPQLTRNVYLLTYLLIWPLQPVTGLGLS